MCSITVSSASTAWSAARLAISWLPPLSPPGVDALDLSLGIFESRALPTMRRVPATVDSGAVNHGHLVGELPREHRKRVGGVTFCQSSLVLMFFVERLDRSIDWPHISGVSKC